jgi:hypothetical protein
LRVVEQGDETMKKTTGLKLRVGIKAGGIALQHNRRALRN